ncbi:MAG TPA: RtcB family protein [Clostridia bacterium]|nr:RtcB family protein [Clostridia bacterium]
MGTYSHITAARGEHLSFSSCCHGVGRGLSRSEAKRAIGRRKLISSLKIEGVAEEVPGA